MAYSAYAWVSEGLFLGLRRLGRETYRARPSKVQVKEEYSCTFTPSVCLPDIQGQVLLSSHSFYFESVDILRSALLWLIT